MCAMKVIFLLFLFCNACLSTRNGVKFVSRNFNNTLHWDPVKPEFPGQNLSHMYTVEYKSDADRLGYRIKAECQNIAALSCDLTAETPSLYDVHYWARVFVNGRLHGNTSTRFKPIAETVLGPPILSMHTTVSSLHVNVTLPLGPNGVSIRDIITSSKDGPNKHMICYIFEITHPEWAVQVHKNTTGQFVIKLKNNNTEYCGYVLYRPFSEWGRVKSENASFCVTLQADPGMLLPWLLITAASLAAILILLVVLMCNYLRGTKQISIPQKLVTFSSALPRQLKPPSEDLQISKVVISPKSDTIYTTIKVKPMASSVGVEGYSPQDVPGQSWQDSSNASVDTNAHSPAPIPDDTSGQSSEIYGVVAVHVPTEETDFQQATDTGTNNLQLLSSEQRWNRGGMCPKLSSHGAPPLSVPDLFDNDQDRPLLLDTARDSNGKLVLSSLTFQLQTNTEDLQRKPLLSDLIDSNTEGPTLASLQSLDCSDWSDSGCDDSTLDTPTQPYCNTNYCPSQVVVPKLHQGFLNAPSSDKDTGYTQKWMPPVLIKTASKDGCECRGTNYLSNWTAVTQEEEGEEKENIREEERSGHSQILLGDWVVQIQK